MRRILILFIALAAFGAWLFGRRSQRGSAKAGREAALDVLENKADKKRAMFRQGLGAVDFRWGVAGEPERDFLGGYGFAHIVAKHGRRAALLAPLVIAFGTLQPAQGERRVIMWRGRKVVLTRTPSRDPRHWVLTSFLPTQSGKKKSIR